MKLFILIFTYLLFLVPDEETTASFHLAGNIQQNDLEFIIENVSIEEVTAKIIVNQDNVVFFNGGEQTFEVGELKNLSFSISNPNQSTYTLEVTEIVNGSEGASYSISIQ